MAKRGKIQVQHGIACLEANIEPPVGLHNFYNLLQVGYQHAVPADTEFPWSFPRLDMFGRFYGGIGTAEFAIRVGGVDAPVRGANNVAVISFLEFVLGYSGPGQWKSKRTRGDFVNASKTIPD